MTPSGCEFITAPPLGDGDWLIPPTVTRLLVASLIPNAVVRLATANPESNARS